MGTAFIVVSRGNALLSSWAELEQEPTHPVKTGAPFEMVFVSSF